MRRKIVGMNIISGPTGSGKSTTLQRALSAVMAEKRGQVNVITIEDPPEYVIKGAAQLPVTNATTDDERNEKFRQAISASLRSDPDRSDEHKSELQSLMRTSYAAFCLKKKKNIPHPKPNK